MGRSIADRVEGLERALTSMDVDKERLSLTGEDGRPIPFDDMEAVIVSALERIGLGWEEGRIALSQVYMSGRHCEELLSELLPVAERDGEDSPRLAIAVLEDYHFLGMRLVSSVLRAGGFALRSYG